MSNKVDLREGKEKSDRSWNSQNQLQSVESKRASEESLMIYPHYFSLFYYFHFSKIEWKCHYIKENLSKKNKWEKTLANSTNYKDN